MSDDVSRNSRIQTYLCCMLTESMLHVKGISMPQYISQIITISNDFFFSTSILQSMHSIRYCFLRMQFINEQTIVIQSKIFNTI